jgi:hypothetical protein
MERCHLASFPLLTPHLPFSRARIDHASSLPTQAASSTHTESMHAKDEDADCGVGLVLQPAPIPPTQWGGGSSTEGGGERSGSAEWVVAAVRPGGPADASGAVRLGDRVASVNGYPLQARPAPPWPVRRRRRPADPLSARPRRRGGWCVRANLKGGCRCRLRWRHSSASPSPIGLAVRVTAPFHRNIPPHTHTLDAGTARAGAGPSVGRHTGPALPRTRPASLRVPPAGARPPSPRRPPRRAQGGACSTSTCC